MPTALSDLPAATRHIVIDLQRLFAEETVWHTPDIPVILPNVLRLSQTYRDRTFYAKFMVPRTPAQATGRWRNYYKRWSMLTTDNMDPALLDLVAPLAALAMDGSVIEKTTYSIFGTAGFAERLADEKVETLVFSGVETDVCVYASVLDAIDFGFHVIVVSDAVCSSDPDAHKATLRHLMPRLSEQLDIATTEDVLAAWRP